MAAKGKGSYRRAKKKVTAKKLLGGGDDLG